LVEEHWNDVNLAIGANAYFTISDRVAVALHYLAQPGAFHQSNQLFGMGKASAVRYFWQVVRVLKHRLQSKVITLPTTETKWA
jgi:hypothetical protein